MTECQGIHSGYCIKSRILYKLKNKNIPKIRANIQESDTGSQILEKTKKLQSLHVLHVLNIAISLSLLVVGSRLETDDWRLISS
jgi:hypothetical protein